jgi:pyroglutamyl-peptidase
MRLILTGFGPFGSFETNPSQVLVERMGRPLSVLEVSFSAVEQWLDILDPESFDALLMVGVDGRASRMRLETVGKNLIGDAPDVTGRCLAGAAIAVGGPERLGSTLWYDVLNDAGFMSESLCLESNDDAGSYLCNFALYSALHRFPDKKVGFLHIPSFDRLSLVCQAEGLDGLLRRLEG